MLGLVNFDLVYLENQGFEDQGIDDRSIDHNLYKDNKLNHYILKVTSLFYNFLNY